MTVVPPRSEIAPEHTWNAESVFPTREDWHTAYEALAEDLKAAGAFKGRLHEGPETLADYYDLVEDLTMRMGALRTYTVMASNVDSGDQEANAMFGQVTGLMSQLGAAFAFAEPELLSMGEETLRAWVAEEQRLAFLEHYIDDLFRKQAHVQSAEVEAALNLMSGPLMGLYTTYSMLTNADIDFGSAQNSAGDEVPVAQSNIRQIHNSADRTLRRTGYEQYTGAYLRFQNTLATSYIARVQAAVADMRIRGHESTLHAALHDSNVPVAVFHNLIETFKRHLPTWHRYWRIRREALGYDELHPYDIWAPLTENAPEVPYEQAVEWISAGMSPLGDGYVSIMRRGTLEERWVDIYPNQGKRIGAFSMGSKSTHPFIMMSYGDDLPAMSTLAHELGHSMHSYFTGREQSVLYTRYSMFVAEVASNFNQAMTRAYLLGEKDDPDFQIALIEEAMSNFHRYFFIMPTLARFEYEVHSRVIAGKSPTAPELNALMADLFAEGYGDEMTVDRDRVGITWATFQHLYVPFYTFQYATGISGAHALSARILDGVEGAADDYLSFLKAGNALYPMDALQMAGVDMSTPAPVEETFGVMEGLIDRLESLT